MMLRNVTLIGIAAVVIAGSIGFGWPAYDRWAHPKTGSSQHYIPTAEESLDFWAKQAPFSAPNKVSTRPITN